MSGEDGGEEHDLLGPWPLEERPWAGEEPSERGEYFRELLETHLPDVDVPVMGGSETIYLFRELRFCFTMGFFISSIILSAATIEQILARQIRVENQDTWDETLGPTIEKAEELEIISTKLACQADELRKLRNGYIHYRDRSDEEDSPSYVREQNDKWGDALPFRIAEEDAEEAIEITIKIHGAIYDDVTIGEN